MTQRILILGGTTEARRLPEGWPARRSAVTLSLAGRTANPAPQRVPVRIGGFGGAAGLAVSGASEGIDLLIDATHPYAAQISANAAAAAAATGVRAAGAAAARPGGRQRATAGPRSTTRRSRRRPLGNAPRRVFLALGRKSSQPFEAAPQHHYLVRSVDPVEPPLARAGRRLSHSRAARSTEADDRALLEPTASTPWSPRTAAAAPPTARSRRRARSASR